MRSILIAAVGLANTVLAQSSGVGANTTKASFTKDYLIKHILDIYFNNNSTSLSAGAVPGLFPEPYYWWESGLAFDTLINYWAYTGDDSIVPIITEGLVFQTGPNDDYMPPNQTKSLGNDDQSTWGLAAMSAAELGLPAPEDSNITWYDLAKNVFDSQVQRWDAETCGGGFRWQIFSFNSGYTYKNTVTQANFAQLGVQQG